VILAGRAETLTSHQLRAGMRRILGRFVDLKSLDGILELSWHADQLHCVGAGLKPTSIADASLPRSRCSAATARRHSDARVVYDVRRYSLSDKVVLITGAGRGLGAATATALTQRGALVVLADADLSAAQRVAATLPNGQGLALKCDVTQIDSVQEVVRRTPGGVWAHRCRDCQRRHFGRGGTFRTLTPDQVGGVMSVNVAGVVNTVTAT
jgi:hypothetical protein